MAQAAARPARRRVVRVHDGAQIAHLTALGAARHRLLGRLGWDVDRRGLHVDGPFGLWAATSPRYARLTRGLEGADSWTTDGHKWLNVPFDSGFAFVRDAAAHRAAMTMSASYLISAAAGGGAGRPARDQIDWNPEWSRRGRAVAVYAAIRALGREGIRAMIERCCDHAHRLVHGIGALPDAQVLVEPTINQGLVRFSPTTRTTTGAPTR